MIREQFIQVQESRRITGKALSDITGISTNHIAQFRVGNKQLTTHKLWQLVEAMEQISPGARADFCHRMSWGEGLDFDSFDSQELIDMVKEIAEVLEQKRVNQKR